MSGNYLLDTNAIISAMNSGLILPEADYAFSVITEMELLSYPALAAEEESTVKSLLRQLVAIDLTPPVRGVAIELRKKYKCKLPDAIILSSALVTERILVTDDQRLLNIGEVRSVVLNDLAI